MHISITRLNTTFLKTKASGSFGAGNFPLPPFKSTSWGFLPKSSRRPSTRMNPAVWKNFVKSLDTSLSSATTPTPLIAKQKIKNKQKTKKINIQIIIYNNNPFFLFFYLFSFFSHPYFFFFLHVSFF